MEQDYQILLLFLAWAITAIIGGIYLLPRTTIALLRSMIEIIGLDEEEEEKPLIINEEDFV